MPRSNENKSSMRVDEMKVDCILPFAKLNSVGFIMGFIYSNQPPYGCSLRMGIILTRAGMLYQRGDSGLFYIR